MVIGKKILTSLLCRSNSLNILTISHLSSHLLAILAELKPTPNRTNWATQHIYDSRSNKNKKNKQKWNWMIVSRVESKSIRNTNETEDSNKNRNEICKKLWNSTQICWICWKYTKRNENNKKKANFKGWRKTDPFTTS